MKHIYSWSGGKDSTALLLYAIKHKMPIDDVIICDIKFNDKISGEMPLMAEWLPKAEEKINKLLKDSGYKCKITHLTAKKNFYEQFYTIKEKGNHIGDNYGFPFTISAWCNGRLKLDPINKYINEQLQKDNVTEYVGIASDESKRLKRYKNISNEQHKYITLADFGINEQHAIEICNKYDLLSPIYESSFRGGCWFCIKQSISQLKNLFVNYRHLWDILRDMEKDSHNTFRPDYTLEQLEKRFIEEDMQLTLFDLSQKGIRYGKKNKQ